MSKTINEIRVEKALAVLEKIKTTKTAKFNWLDRGFCIECGADIMRFNRRTLFCNDCMSSPSHKTAHAIVYNLLEAVKYLDELVIDP